MDDDVKEIFELWKQWAEKIELRINALQKEIENLKGRVR